MRLHVLLTFVAAAAAALPATGPAPAPGAARALQACSSECAGLFKCVNGECVYQAAVGSSSQCVTPYNYATTPLPSPGGAGLMCYSTTDFTSGSVTQLVANPYGLCQVLTCACQRPYNYGASGCSGICGGLGDLYCGCDSGVAIGSKTIFASQLAQSNVAYQYSSQSRYSPTSGEINIGFTAQFCNTDGCNAVLTCPSSSSGTTLTDGGVAAIVVVSLLLVFGGGIAAYVLFTRSRARAHAVVAKVDTTAGSGLPPSYAVNPAAAAARAAALAAPPPMPPPPLATYAAAVARVPAFAALPPPLPPQPPPLPPPPSAVLPPGWEKFGPDEVGDVWYSDALVRTLELRRQCALPSAPLMLHLNPLPTPSSRETRTGSCPTPCNGCGEYRASPR